MFIANIKLNGEKKYFEQLTATNYIKILFEEYRWKNKKAVDFKVEVEK